MNHLTVSMVLNLFTISVPSLNKAALIDAKLPAGERVLSWQLLAARNRQRFEAKKGMPNSGEIELKGNKAWLKGVPRKRNNPTPRTIKLGLDCRT